jgi:peptidoglycan/xylan/chitin deacetylase (PgdA/CDA1 family)
MESFPASTNSILDSGAEIACHGYAHEGGAQMSEEQERDVIRKCVELATKLTGKRPSGWRAPLYQIREHTIKVLEEEGFLYGRLLFPPSPLQLLPHPLSSLKSSELELTGPTLTSIQTHH